MVQYSMRYDIMLLGGVLMKSGIYLIENIANNKKYVGQSLNVNGRIGRHKSYLKRQAHENQYLQRAYNKYGAKNFKFKVLEKCPIEDLDDKEIYYISKFETLDYEKGYNLEGGGNAGKIISETTRLKKVGKNNPMYGKKVSDKTKKKMSESSRGKNNKLSEEDVVEIKKLLIKGIEQKEIGDIYGVTFSTISKIATFKNWEYVRPDLNDEYLKVKALKEKEDIDTVLRLWDEGKSLRGIQEKTHIDRRKSREIIRQYRDNQED